MGMSVPERRVIVVGGGAAGMMASIFAGKAGARVTLLERGEKLGKKVYITGKGRCNVTNDCTLDEFLHEVARNPRFLYSALSFFSPQDMMQLLEDAGCPVVVQRGRRVFPATEKASDVTRTLARLMQQSGVEVRYGSRVQALMTETTEDGALHATGVRLMDGTALPAERVILATGGLSCPLTGSTGDGYRLAESVGHTTTPRMGVLSAIETDCDWCGRLQGLALKNVALTLKKGKKVLYSDLGEMLFTHFGISGPLTLTMSCHLPENLAEANVTLDLKPGLTAQQLDTRLQRELAEDSRRQLRNVLPHLLPASFAEIFPELSATEQREMGYWLGRPYWGHGVMTEAATELLRFGFETLGLEAVWCSHYDWNSRSRRVIEKCGFRYQFTKETTNVIGMTNKTVFYALKKEEWLAFSGEKEFA